MFVWDFQISLWWWVKLIRLVREWVLSFSMMCDLQVFMVFLLRNSCWVMVLLVLLLVRYCSMVILWLERFFSMWVLLLWFCWLMLCNVLVGKWMQLVSMVLVVSSSLERFFFLLMKFMVLVCRYCGVNCVGFCWVRIRILVFSFRDFRWVIILRLLILGMLMFRMVRLGDFLWVICRVLVLLLVLLMMVKLLCLNSKCMVRWIVG